MTNLKEELASLKIDQQSRASGGRRGGTIAIVAILLLAAAAGGWYWSRGAQAASVASRSSGNARLNAGRVATARSNSSL